jgi:hypothetical protein
MGPHIRLWHETDQSAGWGRSEVIGARQTDAFDPGMDMRSYTGRAACRLEVVILVLLKDGEHAGWRLASRGAGRHGRAKDPAVGVVESDLLALD